MAGRKIVKPSKKTVKKTEEVKTVKKVVKKEEPKVEVAKVEKEAFVTNEITTKDILFKAIMSNTEGEFTKAQISDIYDAFVESIVNVSKNDSDEIKIVLPEIGRFKVAVREAYDSKNPRTGEAIKVPSKKRMSFKAYPKFIEKINGEA